MKGKACHRNSALTYQQIISASISLIRLFAIEDLEEDRTDGIKLHAIADRRGIKEIFEKIFPGRWPLD